MRKKINLIVCIMIVACVALFAAACAPKDADGLIKLSAPSNLELNGSVLSWGDVKNAEKYFISVNGVENEQSVTSTTFDLSAIVSGYGNFSISVRAYGDGKKYGTSDNSKTIVYHKGNALDTPIITIDGKVAKWGAVANAENYAVKVTDEKNAIVDELTTQALTYTFEKKTDSADASGEAQQEDVYSAYGAYRISVTANPASDDVEYSPSLPGTATYCNSTDLTIPQFKSMSSTTLSWDAIANATSYTVRKTFDDGETYEYEDAEVTSTSVNYTTKFKYDKIGKYTFTVRANGDSGENIVYKTSDFSKPNEDYVVTKLAAVEADDVELKYDGEVATLKWKLPANSLATEFSLDLLPPAEGIKLESSILQFRISNNLKFVEASVYDFYKYDADGEKIIKEDSTILVYNMEGVVKVRYGNYDGDQNKKIDYYLQDKEGNNVEWKTYQDNTVAASRVDIICDMSDPGKIKFINESKTYNDGDGSVLPQNTGEKKDVLDFDGKQLWFYENTSRDNAKFNVTKGVEYDKVNNKEIKYHTFEVILDDIFINKTEENPYNNIDGMDNKYYGVLYDVSITADNNSNQFMKSQSVVTDGQYMSYKVPKKDDYGKFIIKEKGEYAYIVLNSYAKQNNTDNFFIEANIDFNGHEIVQINTFSGIIDGDMHTVSSIVVGNKIMTEKGVVKNDGVSDLEYAMFINIDNKGDTRTGIVKNVFYVGMSFVGYDKEKLEENVSSIKVAPIAINNKGAIYDVLVQSDSIKAEGAQVAGLVINNYGNVVVASVYADLEGTIVGGVAINNNEGSLLDNVGFYGKVTATLSDVLTDGVTSVSGAGFVVNNGGGISDSFAIGDVSVSATGLDSIYAGGFVAVNTGLISTSYSGEFTLNNVGTKVEANGDNAYAGGFVADNKGEITSCYSTNDETSASMYVGGFVGYNDNSASITSCYATGGTARTGENRGAFVGKNAGNIVKSVAYSTDSWAEDKVVQVLKSSEQLEDIVTILYGEGEVDMVLLRDQGYRNPLIKGLIYTKEITVSMRPSQTISTRGIVYVGEVKDTEATLRGDNSKKDNRVVIELSYDGVQSRYVYGYVK